MRETRKIAIIGLGPRGGFALENLVGQLAAKKALTRIHISLFEQTENLGNGPVYDVQQNSSNWINITERILDLPPRDALFHESIHIDPFPSYHQWAFDKRNIDEYEPDTYPPRAKMGQYLSQRLNSFLGPLVRSGLIKIYKQRVDLIEWKENGQLRIQTENDLFDEFDEALLTIGHQPSIDDDQIIAWQQFSRTNGNCFLYKEPYPLTQYLHHDVLEKNSKLGIRGFGLAMIDVTRAFALKYGQFISTDAHTKSCRYTINGQHKDVIIPFSLDGLPPVPKPLNAHIDSWFKPSEKALSQFSDVIGNESNQKTAKSYFFLIDAFVPIATSIYTSLSGKTEQKAIPESEIKETVKQWLIDQTYQHPLLVSSQKTTIDMLKGFVAMAVGKKKISLDYCIGQVWRHCQPTIYKALSHNQCNNKVFGEIIQLDEAIKRYSYGPPVASIQQLIALTEAEFLNLDFVDNPSITTGEQGWLLSQHDKTIITSIMIDSVLDPPKIAAVESPIIRKLLIDKIIQSAHSEFGVLTDEHGYLLSQDKAKKIPIALLGRLAKGTVIGVDAILECFGIRPIIWAEKAAERHIKWLQK